MSSWFSVDDRHPQIHYDGDWSLRTVARGGMVGRTLHVTNSEGSSASFHFEGTGVMVYGAVPANCTDLIKVDFTIDDSTTYPVERECHTEAQYDVPWLYLDDSGFLPFGNHSLTITYRGGGEFMMDWIDYNGTDWRERSHSGRTRVAGQNGGLSTHVVTSIQVVETQAAKPSQGSIPTGGIVGIAIGGLVVVSLLVIAFVFFFRRRRRINHNSTVPLSTPFDIFEAFNPISKRDQDPNDPPPAYREVILDVQTRPTQLPRTMSVSQVDLEADRTGSTANTPQKPV
ncbi:hypothetical protein CC2G_011202 [Coprinopsis cinerea AmutBmut pab1-1]|nr:hypothetical protein CC2G_011202 [Coprinopsis cinerea AmutBmut pab1-1]